MGQITFHWESSKETPDLLMAVGVVTLTWARIDNQITEALRIFWWDYKPKDAIPRAFDRRINALAEFVTPLYESEPDERRQFRWFVQRLKDANGQRDEIAHGIPGTITKMGRTFEGLMVPQHSKETKYVPKPLRNIVKLGHTLRQLEAEASQVAGALIALRNASRGTIREWNPIDGWHHVTMSNRKTRLPKINTPPPSFEG